MIKASTLVPLFALLFICFAYPTTAQTGLPFKFLKLFQKANATAQYKLYHPMLDGGMTLTHRGSEYSSEYQTNCTWIEKSFQMGRFFSCSYFYCYRLDESDSQNHKLYLMGKYYRCPNLVSIRYYPNGILHYAQNETVYSYTGNSVTNYEVLGNSSTVQAHEYKITVSTFTNVTQLQLPVQGNFTVLQVNEQINGTLKQVSYWNDVHGLLVGSGCTVTNITYPQDPLPPKAEISQKVPPPITNGSSTCSSTISSLLVMVVSLLFVMISI